MMHTVPFVINLQTPNVHIENPDVKIISLQAKTTTG